MNVLLSVIVGLLSVSAFATTSQEVGQKTSDAAAAAVSYTKEQKEEFQKSMETKLSQLNAEIEELKKTSAEKSESVKADTKKRIQALDIRKEELKKDLAKMKSRSGKAWGEMKSGMSKAWDSLKDSYDKAKTELNSQE